MSKESPVRRDYGSFNVRGAQYTDKVCLSLDTCVSDFEFVVVDYAEALPRQIEGVLGLAHNN